MTHPSEEDGDRRPVTLDLGDRRSPSEQDERPAAREPDAPRLRRVLAAAGAGLLVVAVAAPQPRAVPSADDVRVALAPGPLEPATLDVLRVTAGIHNDGRFPVTVRTARLSRNPLAGVLPSSLTVPAAGTAELALPARPDCADHGTDALDLTLTAAGGTRRVRAPVRTVEAYAELCPPTEPGLHAAVTGTRLTAGGAQVQVRVVNRGTVLLAVGLAGDAQRRRSRSVTESATGLTVADPDGAPAPPPPALVAVPALPVLLQPDDAVVLTLRPVADPCTPDPAALTLRAREVPPPGDRTRRGLPRGDRPSVPVEGSDPVTATLLTSAEAVCRQRSP